MRRLVLAGLALVAGLAFLLGALADPGRAAQAYLAAYTYWLTLVLGLLCLVLIAYAARARWMALLVRCFELCTTGTWALALLFVPVVLLRRELYPFARPLEKLPEVFHEAVEHRAPLASTWIMRAVLYLAVWIGTSEWLVRLSLRRDQTPSPELSHRMQRFAAVALPCFALSLTAMSFDWLMPLDPRFASTMFGVYVFAGAFLGALAAAVLLIRRVAPLREAATPGHYGALGRLLFGFVVFWAYIAYCQFFIIWMADMPEEVPWYAARLEHGWFEVSVALGLLHFALPFFVLLPRDLKRRGGQLAVVAAYLLIAHGLDVFWLVMPAFGPPRPHWLDAAAFVFVGAALGLAVLLRARRLPLVPRHHPDLEASLGYQGT